MKGLIYLAGPIDLLTGSHESKEEVAKILYDRGYSVYAPWTAFRHADGNGAFIRNANFAVIKESTVMLAIIDRYCYSHGTTMDIEFAVDNHVPVFVVIGGGKPTAYMEGIPCFGTVEEAVEAIENLVNSATKVREAFMGAWSPALKMLGLAEPVEDEEPGEECWGCQHLADCFPGHDEAPEASETYLPCVTEDGHPLPEKSYPDDAGFDLYVKGRHVVQGHSWADIEVGTSVALPEGYWGLVLGRSSTFYKLRLQVHPAVIDTGWRGGLKISVFNTDGERVTIEDKDRIAQIIPIASPKMKIVQVDRLPDGSRGDNGFGSSGR